MSITFTPIDTNGRHVGALERRETACLCAQGCPGWDMNAPESLRPALREHADPGCHFCGGSGVEVENVNDLFLNLCNGNARALLALLGIVSDPDRRPFDFSGPVFPEPPSAGDELWGRLDLPEARRAIMRARASFDRRAPTLVREPAIVVAPARVEHDGNLARVVPGATFSTGGFDTSDLADRLNAFASLVEEGARLGAVAITWG